MELLSLILSETPIIVIYPGTHPFLQFAFDFQIQLIFLFSLFVVFVSIILLQI